MQEFTELCYQYVYTQLRKWEDMDGQKITESIQREYKEYAKREYRSIQRENTRSMQREYKKYTRENTSSIQT